VEKRKKAKKSLYFLGILNHQPITLDAVDLLENSKPGKMGIIFFLENLKLITHLKLV